MSVQKVPPIWPQIRPESLTDGARPLPAAKEEELRKVCEEAGLPADVAEKVVRAARLIQSALEHEEPASMTPEALFDHLGRLSSKARELLDLLAAMTHHDQERLHQKMLDAAASDGRLSSPGEASAAALRPIAHQLAELAKAANALQIDIDVFRKGGGRLRTSPMREIYVELVWRAVSDTGMTLGRGGTFARLCDAVFSAAGVPAGADWPVRRLSESMAKTNRTDRENSP